MQQPVVVVVVVLVVVLVVVEVSKILSTTTKSARSKKLKLTKIKKSDFAKANSSETDFLIPEAKKAFIHLRKAFIKAPILRHFDLEYHIRIETNTLEYTISEVFS